MKDPFKFLIYQSAETDVTVSAIVRDKTIWLSQKAMAELFAVEVPAINKHLANIYTEGELNQDSTISKMEIVQIEGKRKVKRTIDSITSTPSYQSATASIPAKPPNSASGQRVS